MSRRVGLVTYALRVGGVETFLIRLSRFLRNAGFDVEILTTEARGDWFDVASQQGCKVVDLGGPDESHWLEPARHAARIGRQLRDAQFDVLFLNHARYAQSSLGMVPERTIAIPIIHNDTAGMYRVALANKAAWNVAVGVSPKVTQVASNQVSDKPVITIPYGIDLPATAALTRRASFESPLKVLYLGRLEHHQKGILHLPEILKAIVSQRCAVELKIVGDGPDSTRLKTLFAESGLSRHVQFAGAVPAEYAYAELLHAHVLLMPSYFEGLPITLLEAMACGCVPVISLLPGITDFAVEQHVSGLLVTAGDTQAFADSIVTLANSKPLWESMSAACRIRAEAHFSVDRMGGAYAQLVDDALSGTYPTRRLRTRISPIDTELFRLAEYSPSRLRRRVRATLHKWRPPRLA